MRTSSTDGRWRCEGLRTQGPGRAGMLPPVPAAAATVSKAGLSTHSFSLRRCRWGLVRSRGVQTCRRAAGAPREGLSWGGPRRASRCLALCCRLPSLAWLQPRGGHEGGGRG